MGAVDSSCKCFHHLDKSTVNGKLDAAQISEDDPIFTSPQVAAAKGSDASQDRDDEAERHKIQKAHAQHRGAVSAKAISEAEIKAYKCPCYPKSDDAQQKIQSALKSNEKMSLLGIHGLNGADLNELIMAFQEKNVSGPEAVITQGDEGDCLYIVDSGAFDVFVARKREDGEFGEPSKVTEYSAGSLFGELALMYNAPRAATVRCVSQSAHVWTLDREPFQMMLKRCGIEMTDQYSGWLTEIDILKTLNLHEISRIADACDTELFEEGEVIIRQGDQGDAFYILEEGACGAFLPKGGGVHLAKKYEAQGEYFGELALLNEKPRVASIKALRDSSVLKIPQSVFQTELKPIHDRLRELAKQYPIRKLRSMKSVDPE